MENNDRYSGPATVIRSYMNAFLVECPRCMHCAIVSKGRSFDKTDAKLTCQNCNYSEHAAQLVRYNAIVKRACDNCGKAIEAKIPNNKEKVKELNLSCPHCGIVRSYKPRSISYNLFYKNSGPGDPVFNLPLWFQAEIRGTLFWAYNREHLNEIRNYVAAKLRERQTVMYTTMVERLPDFITTAKNRSLVIKTIDKLLRK